MEDLICLDTGIVVALLRKSEFSWRWLHSLSPETIVSTTLITLFELYRGVYLGSRIKEELTDIKDLLESITILPFTQEHMNEAARVSVELQKKGISLDIRDLLIGVCAREEGSSLKTNNKKHFENIPELTLAD